jgi:hypothetical protein
MLPRLLDKKMEDMCPPLPSEKDGKRGRNEDQVPRRLKPLLLSSKKAFNATKRRAIGFSLAGSLRPRSSDEGRRFVLAYHEEI